MASEGWMLFLFTLFSLLLLSQNMHSDPLSLCLQWESPSLHMTSHSPPSVSSVFQLPLLFGLIAQRGDQGLNIDSRGESPCVLKQFFVCLPCYPLVPLRPSAPSASLRSLSLSRWVFVFDPDTWKKSSHLPWANLSLIQPRHVREQGAIWGEDGTHSQMKNKKNTTP